MTRCSHRSAIVQQTPTSQTYRRLSLFLAIKPAFRKRPMMVVQLRFRPEKRWCSFSQADQEGASRLQESDRITATHGDRGAFLLYLFLASPLQRLGHHCCNRSNGICETVFSPTEIQLLEDSGRFHVISRCKHSRSYRKSFLGETVAPYYPVRLLGSCWMFAE